MKPTIKNRIKLWWHCLWRMMEGHRMVTVQEKKAGQIFFRTKNIGCSECDKEIFNLPS